MLFIPIDIDDVINLSIKPDHYVFMHMINTRNYTKIYKVWSLEEIKTILEFLESITLLKHGNNLSENNINLDKVIIKFKFLSKINTYDDTDLFSELFSKYPSKGGSRRLRIDKHKSKERYEKIVKGDLGLHKKILACLDIEIEELRRSGRLQYMKSLPAWINNRGWEVYEEELTSNPDEEDAYGTQIV